MNRAQAKELLPIIQAFAEGGVVQFNKGVDGWEDMSNPGWNCTADCYRIKPEPRVVEVVFSTKDGSYVNNSLNMGLHLYKNNPEYTIVKFVEQQ